MGGRGGGRGPAAAAALRAHATGGRARPRGQGRQSRSLSTGRLGARVTPERASRLVRRWVRFYTRDLPTPIAQRRVEEIEADLHDHIAHERACGTSDRRIAVRIVSRMVRGLGADATYRPAVRVATATGLILLVPLVAMQFSDEMAWTPADFVVAGVLLFSAGRAYQLVARRA